MRRLTEDEFKEVTKSFTERLCNEMSNAGCNDVYSDEFPETICEDFDSDLDLLDVWSSMITMKQERINNE